MKKHCELCKARELRRDGSKFCTEYGVECRKVVGCDTWQNFGIEQTTLQLGLDPVQVRMRLPSFGFLDMLEPTLEVDEEQDDTTAGSTQTKTQRATA